MKNQHNNTTPFKLLMDKFRLRLAPPTILGITYFNRYIFDTQIHNQLFIDIEEQSIQHHSRFLWRITITSQIPIQIHSKK